MDRACRVCAKQDIAQNLYNLFDGSPAMNDLVPFLKSSLHINIDKNDLLPTKICEHCALRCNYFLLFWKECDKAKIELNHKVTYQPVVRSENGQLRETDQSTCINSDSSAEDETLIPGEIVEVVMKSEDELSDSENADTIQIEVDGADMNEQSNHDDEGFTTQKSQLNNTSSTLIELDSELENVEKLPPVAPKPVKREFSCNICFIRTVNRKQLSTHLRMNHRGTSLFCSMCDYATTGKDLLNQHVRVCHEKKFKCPICPNAFGKKIKLKMHTTNMHTDGKKLICNLCNQSFFQKYKFQQHEKSVHIVNGRWTCTICPKNSIGDINFAQRQQLEFHMNKNHLENKKIDCPELGCKFTTQHKYYMTKHNREVHDNKFKNKECGKLESKQHMKRKHSSKEKINCPICKKSFISQGWFQRHILAESCRSQTTSFYPATTIPFFP